MSCIFISSKIFFLSNLHITIKQFYYRISKNITYFTYLCLICLLHLPTLHGYQQRIKLQRRLYRINNPLFPANREGHSFEVYLKKFEVSENFIFYAR